MSLNHIMGLFFPGILVLLGGCHRKEISGDTCRYLALGDSYTIGESVKETERWPVLLAEQLRKKNRLKVELQIVARTGWTTDELMAGMDTVDIQGPYDLVTLLIGVNNQYRGRNTDEFKDQFRQLLERAIRLAGGRAQRVLIVSIPDWGVTPFAGSRDRDRIAREIDAFNLIKQREALRYGAYYVDITPLSRKAAADSSLIASDGLHPSGRMYEAWVKRLIPEVRKMLQTPLQEQE